MKMFIYLFLYLNITTNINLQICINNCTHNKIKLFYIADINMQFQSTKLIITDCFSVFEFDLLIRMCRSHSITGGARLQYVTYCHFVVFHITIVTYIMCCRCTLQLIYALLPDTLYQWDCRFYTSVIVHLTFCLLRITFKILDILIYSIDG